MQSVPPKAVAGEASPYAELPEAVRHVLGATSHADASSVEREELAHNTGNQATGGIWRVRGPRGSVVLKIATGRGTGGAAPALLPEIAATLPDLVAEWARAAALE